MTDLAAAEIAYIRRLGLSGDSIHNMRLLLVHTIFDDFERRFTDPVESEFLKRSELDCSLIWALQVCLFKIDANVHVAGPLSKVELIPDLPGESGERLREIHFEADSPYRHAG